MSLVLLKIDGSTKSFEIIWTVGEVVSETEMVIDLDSPLLPLKYHRRCCVVSVESFHVFKSDDEEYNV